MYIPIYIYIYQTYIDYPMIQLPTRAGPGDLDREQDPRHCRLLCLGKWNDNPHGRWVAEENPGMETMKIYENHGIYIQCILFFHIVSHIFHGFFPGMLF